VFDLVHHLFIANPRGCPRGGRVFVSGFMELRRRGWLCVS
jgi:hypothetical protein